MSAPEGVRTRDPDRRERILRAAAELVAARGFHAVSMADIGAASGIVGSGVYRHFESKSAVLAALLDDGMQRLRELLGPEAIGLDVEVFALPNLRAVNAVVHGLLGDGVASSTRPDPQAKGLGEYLRSRLVDVPRHLLDG